LAVGQRQERLRAVFDCMVFLQGAARRRSPAGLCLSLAERGLIELCVSEDIFREVADVLSRPRVRAKFTVLRPEFVKDFIRILRAMSTVFEDVPRAIAFSRDPKDEPYLNLAVRAQAHYLISRDNDVLGLSARRPRRGGTPKKRCPQLQIVEPSAFIAAMESRLKLVE
jgi:putative PIN family toxin of toxin-antitoxin system